MNIRKIQNKNVLNEFFILFFLFSFLFISLTPPTFISSLILPHPFRSHLSSFSLLSSLLTTTTSLEILFPIHHPFLFSFYQPPLSIHPFNPHPSFSFLFSTTTCFSLFCPLSLAPLSSANPLLLLSVQSPYLFLHLSLSSLCSTIRLSAPLCSTTCLLLPSLLPLFFQPLSVLYLLFLLLSVLPQFFHSPLVFSSSLFLHSSLARRCSSTRL